MLNVKSQDQNVEGERRATVQVPVRCGGRLLEALVPQSQNHSGVKMSATSFARSHCHVCRINTMD